MVCEIKSVRMQHLNAKLILIMYHYHRIKVPSYQLTKDSAISQSVTMTVEETLDDFFDVFAMKFPESVCGPFNPSCTKKDMSKKRYKLNYVSTMNDTYSRCVSRDQLNSSRQPFKYKAF